jgi:hypothetical protein
MSYLSGMGGVDGFRIDAIKHLDWGWQYSLANSIYTFGARAHSLRLAVYRDWRISPGRLDWTVTNSSSQVSNGIQYTVLAAKLIPITFTVNNASPTQVGDYIFLTGNTVELGNWSTTWDGAAGPFLTPNYPSWFNVVSVPAGQTIQFKFIKIAANGSVTWEAGSNHTYTVPSSGTGSVNVNWQY